MVWFTIVGLSTVVGYFVVLSRRTKRTSRARPPQPSTAASPLSVEEARAKVDGIIADGEKLVVEPVGGAVRGPEQLGPTTREFFAKYGSLRLRHGGCRLSVAEIKASEFLHGYLSIGHSEDWDVVQRPGDDEVFVVEGSETREVEMDVRFPSVYHLILDEAQRA